MCTIACVRGSPALADPPAGDDGEAVFMEHMHLPSTQFMHVMPICTCHPPSAPMHMPHEGGYGEERAHACVSPGHADV